jgi:hypothetical protein
MADSRDQMTSPTANWPSKYRARFWSHRSLPMQVSAVQFTVGVLKAPKRVVGAIGIVAAAFAVGVVIAVVATIPTYWVLFGLIIVGFVVFCVVVSVLSYPYGPYGSAMLDMYHPGTRCFVVVSDGLLTWSLNGHAFQRPVADVVKIWRFGELSAIAFSNGRSVVIPSPFVPHRTAPGAGPEINKRWRKPASEPASEPASDPAN